MQEVGIGATRCSGSMKKIGAPLGQMEGIDAQSPKSSLGTEKTTRCGGPKNRTLTNDITLKQWTYSSTLWSLMAAHLVVDRFIENV
jgi:hypothetical protein